MVWSDENTPGQIVLILNINLSKEENKQTNKQNG